MSELQNNATTPDYSPLTFMTSTTPLVSQPQLGLLNNSYLHNITGGSFNNVAGDSHNYNSFASSTTNCVSPHGIILTLPQL